VKQICLYVPRIYIKLLDEAVDRGFYPNRAEEIRLAIRGLLSSHGKFSVQTDYEPPEKTVLLAVEKRLDDIDERRAALW
jgi:Arc/MetJ-type ribon-helix-helix transcriptional regulator